MIKEAYKVVPMKDETGQELEYTAPVIQKVEITDLDGVSWREAKKQLRQWYLAKAASLRDVTESTYFGD